MLLRFQAAADEYLRQEGRAGGNGATAAAVYPHLQSRNASAAYHYVAQSESDQSSARSKKQLFQISQLNRIILAKLLSLLLFNVCSIAR